MAAVDLINAGDEDDEFDVEEMTEIEPHVDSLPGGTAAVGAILNTGRDRGDLLP